MWDDTNNYNNNNKASLRMSELIDISHAQNLDKMNMFENKLNNTLFDISTIKLLPETSGFTPFVDTI